MKNEHRNRLKKWRCMFFTKKQYLFVQKRALIAWSDLCEIPNDYDIANDISKHREQSSYFNIDVKTA